jgi:hypothetical protein
MGFAALVLCATTVETPRFTAAVNAADATDTVRNFMEKVPLGDSDFAGKLRVPAISSSAGSGAENSTMPHPQEAVMRARWPCSMIDLGCSDETFS